MENLDFFLLLLVAFAGPAIAWVVLWRRHRRYRLEVRAAVQDAIARVDSMGVDSAASPAIRTHGAHTERVPIDEILEAVDRIPEGLEIEQPGVPPWAI